MTKSTKNLYSDKDLKTVQYYIIYNNLTDAYYFARPNSHASPKSKHQTASKYFHRPEIKELLRLETERFKPILENLIDRFEMKRLKAQNKYNLNDIEKMTKEDAETLLNNLIKDNQSDPKAIKDLLPRLIDLKKWNKEKTEVEKSNITQYFIPKKEII